MQEQRKAASWLSWLAVAARRPAAVVLAAGLLGGACTGGGQEPATSKPVPVSSVPVLVGSQPDVVPGPVFDPAPAIGVGGRPGEIHVADMDHDGHLDLVTAHDNTVTVLYGNGNVEFTPGRAVTLSHPPGNMAVGDVDRDGLLDIGVSDHDSYAVDVLLGQPGRRFVAGPSSPVVASEGGTAHTHGFALVDVDNDANLDMITANNADDNLSVLLGDGGGRFMRVSGSPFAVGPSPYPFGTGDVDRDGNLDVVVPRSGTARASVPATP